MLLNCFLIFKNPINYMVKDSYWRTRLIINNLIVNRVIWHEYSRYFLHQAKLIVNKKCGYFKTHYSRHYSLIFNMFNNRKIEFSPFLLTRGGHSLRTQGDIGRRLFKKIYQIQGGDKMAARSQKSDILCSISCY